MGDSRRIQFAVPAPPTRIDVPGVPFSGPVIIIESRQPYYNSAISNAVNNPSSSSSSSSSQAVPASQSSSSLTTNNELHKTCLFCSNFVIVQGGLPNETSEEIAYRTKQLKNVCYLLGVNANVLPTNGTNLQFPFCSDCDTRNKELLLYQEKLEKIKGEMAERVSTIERKVADTKILGFQPTSAIEGKKFVRLYDMILKAYRNKLKRQRRHGELPNVAVDPLDIGAEVEVGDVNLSSSPDNMEGEEEGQSYTNYFEDEGDATDDDNEWNLEQCMNANGDNEGNSTLTISNVRSTATSSSPSTATSASSSGGGQSRRGVSTRAAAAKKKKRRANKAPTASAAAGRNAEGAEAVNLLQIKQEMLAENENDDDEEEEGAATSADVYEVPQRKRRFLFEDVEIINCNGTRRAKNDKFLQCSACPFTLPNLKLTKKEAKEGQSPYDKLKLHIQNVHKNNPGPLKPRTPRQFGCGLCNITFSNLATLREHNRTHPVPASLSCDICARPIKGGHRNLQVHKFSHKNDEERRISLANKERGSYPAFLSGSLSRIYNFKRKKSGSVDGGGASASSRGGRTTSTRTTPVVTRSARAVRKRGSKTEGERGQPHEEGGEPIPSTSAAALAEQSIGAGIVSRRRQAATSGLTTSQPPPTDTEEGEGELRSSTFSPRNC